ncbi:GHKL domain-containing protein [Enterococcus sp.]|uniref:sensor histidine kinase n=1 Tax=Enterococcus sp. TaxID=35783 RepID=UPI0028B0D102|nr:GHKL domain-containing protein [Enterococcus sp.]
MIITTFLVIFRRNNNILRSIGITAHATIILILSDHLVSTTRTYIGFKNNLQGSFSGLFLHCISFSLIAVLLTSLSSFFFSQFQASKQIDLRENRIFILANFFTLITYYCSIIMGSFLGNTSDLIQMNFFFFLLYLCLSIIAFSFYYRAMKAKVEMIKKESDYQALMEYTESMENQYKEVRKFRHDFQNILNSLDDYVLSEDFSGLKNYYLNEIKPTSEEISEMNFKLTELQNIKQREIKSVLALKLMTAQNIEIEVNLEVKEVIEDIPLDAIVLVRVLGILLDNAIEAIEELAIGKLTVAVFKNKQEIQFIIQNDCKDHMPSIQQLKKEGFSTKGDNRGLGLSNIKEMLANYKNVVLKTTIKDQLFTQQFIITRRDI